jgi:hypothetical protein
MTASLRLCVPRIDPENIVDEDLPGTGHLCSVRDEFATRCNIGRRTLARGASTSTSRTRFAFSSTAGFAEGRNVAVEKRINLLEALRRSIAEDKKLAAFRREVAPARKRA